MITLDPGQLEHWLLQLFWPFVRIGACFMIAPVFGAATVPARVRVVLAGGVAALVAPLLPAAPDISPLSGTGLLITVQQVLLGAALGFCLQLTFDAVTLGGQMLANSMGLSFAFNLDPQRGASSSTFRCSRPWYAASRPCPSPSRASARRGCTRWFPGARSSSPGRLRLRCRASRRSWWCTWPSE